MNLPTGIPKAYCPGFAVGLCLTIVQHTFIVPSPFLGASAPNPQTFPGPAHNYAVPSRLRAFPSVDSVPYWSLRWSPGGYSVLRNASSRQVDYARSPPERF